MKRLLATRFGFFGFAAVISLVMSGPIEPEHRWLAFGLAGLYAVLSLLFFLDEMGRAAPRHRQAPAPPSPYAPPPFPGREP